MSTLPSSFIPFSVVVKDHSTISQDTKSSIKEPTSDRNELETTQQQISSLDNVNSSTLSVSTITSVMYPPREIIPEIRYVFSDDQTIIDGGENSSTDPVIIIDFAEDCETITDAKCLSEAWQITSVLKSKRESNNNNTAGSSFPSHPSSEMGSESESRFSGTSLNNPNKPIYLVINGTSSELISKSKTKINSDKKHAHLPTDQKTLNEINRLTELFQIRNEQLQDVLHPIIDN